MREMHKWKDRVEFRLDNRQIFFLFFGVSVVGCFVFALGVMVGKRMDLAGSGPLAAAEDDPLADLDALGGGAEPVPMTFKAGLSASALPDLPKTRSAEEVAERARAQETAEPKVAEPKEAESKVAESAGTGAKAPAGRKAAVPAGGAKAPKAKGAPGQVGPRRFTLQMKAFAKEADARAFADKLRRNGHDVRVETKEVRGRIWHRVRLGSFDSWDEALAAKAAFERAEHVIAYVVRE